MSVLVSPGNLRLFGTVISDQMIWPGDPGFFSAAMVIAALDASPGDVVVMVNSDGGDPQEAEAIRAAFEAHPGKVTVKIVGAAHSAASLMVMAADHIEMSAGSLMLVHDPSIYAAGNAADLSAKAAELDVMAGAYAAVYAARAGITADAAREIMRAETMFTAEAAVEAGFADAVTAPGGAAALAVEMRRDEAREAARAAMSRVIAAQMKFEAGDAGLEDGASQATGQTANDNPGEVQNMPNSNPAATGTPATGATAPVMQGNPAPAAPAPGTPAPAATMSAADAVAQDRARARDIRAAAAPFMAHIPAGEVDRMVNDGVSVDDANRAIMSFAAAGMGAAPRTGAATITRDETETRVEGMIGALMARANPRMHALEGPATEFRGLRLRNLAMSLAGDHGRGFNDIDAIRAGMRSTALMSGGALGTSDFAYITTEVMGRTLRAAYARRAATWGLISVQRTASDFREMHSINAGGDFTLKPVNEAGEYLQSTVSDEAHGLKVAKYGRAINLTFEAIVNDDLGVFERLPGDFARAAASLEARIAWGLIRDNGKMSDGKTLFHADHKNMVAAAAIGVASVGAGRKLMFEQRPAGASAKDDFIAVTPDLLFVPPALETAALQFTAATVPATGGDVNPYASSTRAVSEAMLGAAAGGSDSRWYLGASDMPALEHAYLDGFEAPTVQTKEGMNPDGVSMVARHIFGAAATEYRGLVRNG